MLRMLASTMKRFGRRMLRPFLGRAKLQRMFASLHDLSLAGLNFGEGTHPQQSGEQFVIGFIANRWPPETRPVIFDVGANVGLYTKELRTAFGDSARIWAFEPGVSTFRALEAEFSGAGNIHLRNVGLSDREGAATLHLSDERSKLASLHDTSTRLAGLGRPVTLEESVRLTTLDQFCAAEGIDRIHFLKLDVEGHELNVLNGGAGLLKQERIDAIQFEFGTANIDSRTFFRDFFNLLSERYDLFRVLQDGLYPIDRYKETDEVFKRATNYLALLKSGA